MKTSTEISSIAKHVGEERAIEMVAKAGFDAWDFSMFNMVVVDWTNMTATTTNHPICGKDYLKVARRYKQIGKDNGIYCNQSHAPFPSDIPLVRDFLKRALECTAEAGGKICVIHPFYNSITESNVEKNAEAYLELLPFAKQLGVKIATENMWNWQDGMAARSACSNHEDFRRHLDAINDPYFVACLDIGHAEMKGLNTDLEKMIYALNEKLCALHIHDNDKWHDLHALPFTKSIDFNKMIKALKKIDYKGEFTLEADTYLKEFNSDNVFEGVMKMQKTAKKLANDFENL